MLPGLLRWHRRLALLIALPVMLWVLSGLLHPLMSRLSPVPANTALPSVSFSAEKFATPERLSSSEWLSPAQVAAQAGLHEALALRLVSLSGTVHYQFVQRGQVPARYFSVRDGREVVQGDGLYARELATHYSGLPATTIVSAEKITAFDADYPAVNRLLPVWRVSYGGDDHLQVYVETSSGRLSALIDDSKRLLTQIFQLLHKWSFVSQGAVATIVMVILLTVALFVVCGGLLLYGLLWQRTRGVMGRSAASLWHRRLGLLSVICAAAFMGSGLYHVWHRASVLLPVEVLDSFAIKNLQEYSLHRIFGHMPGVMIVACGGDSICRLTLPAAPAVSGMAGMAAASSEHQHGAAHSSATASLQRLGDMQALDIFSWRQPVLNVLLPPGVVPSLAERQLLTVFSDEYGFLNKRLPVLRYELKTADHLAVYVDLPTGRLAALVRDDDRREGWLFSRLHKYAWLNPAGKNVRDSVMVLAALLLGAVVVLGMVLWLMRSRRGWGGAE